MSDGGDRGVEMELWGLEGERTGKARAVDATEMMAGETRAWCWEKGWHEAGEMYITKSVTVLEWGEEGVM